MFWELEADAGFGEELGVGFFNDLTIDQNEAGFNESLEAGTIVFGVTLDEEVVEADFFGSFVGSGESGIAVNDAGEVGFAELFASNNHILPQMESFLSFEEFSVSDLVGIFFSDFELFEDFLVGDGS